MVLAGDASVMPSFKMDQRHIQGLTKNLAELRKAGNSRQADEIVQLRKLAEAGGVPSLEPFLPLALQLNGKPLTLKDHYPFQPFFSTAMPPYMVWITGRQVGKSQAQAAAGTMLCACVPHFKILYVTPRYEQVRRFSSQYVRPLIDNSPIRGLWLSTGTEKSVLSRAFKNGSMQLFSFALLDADRTRGISVAQNSFDEVQDMDPAHFPIIHESMSASQWKLARYTGTPKSLDNPIEGLWSSSSMAEWVIPCMHCTTNGFRTDNIPSLDGHLMKMIGRGKRAANVSEKYPGVVCHKCGDHLYPRLGHWIHRFKDKRQLFAGYHVPQIILPLHFADPRNWAAILRKEAGWGNTTEAMFLNEVMGQSTDSGQKLVSETELKTAADLPFKNNPVTPSPEVLARLRRYKTKVMAIDWGGGGQEGVSFTVACLIGMLPDGKLECIWGRRFILGCDHLREASELLRHVGMFAPDIIAHDYSGAGIARETIMVQAGFPEERLMPISLIRSASGNFIKEVMPTFNHDRRHFRLDKARSLIYTTQAIRLGLLRFFQWDKQSSEEPGIISDFLALVEEKVDTRNAGPIYTITKNTMLTDDFAQAVNLGCVACWHFNEAWPNFSAAARVARISSKQVEDLGSVDWGWEQGGMEGNFHSVGGL